jgi:hypothetical protein
MGGDVCVSMCQQLLACSWGRRGSPPLTPDAAATAVQRWNTYLPASALLLQHIPMWLWLAVHQAGSKLGGTRPTGWDGHHQPLFSSGQFQNWRYVNIQQLSSSVLSFVESHSTNDIEAPATPGPVNYRCERT